MVSAGIAIDIKVLVLKAAVYERGPKSDRLLNYR
jgi:hypothetical protein